jgi:hypothetical protein
MDLHPSVSDGLFTFHWQEGMPCSELLIYNLHGNLVKKVMPAAGGASIDLRDLPAGTYTAVAGTGDQLYYTRIIILH